MTAPQNEQEHPILPTEFGTTNIPFINLESQLASANALREAAAAYAASAENTQLAREFHDSRANTRSYVKYQQAQRAESEARKRLDEAIAAYDRLKEKGRG